MAVGCSKSELSEYDAPSIGGGAAAQDENAISFMTADNWGDDEEGSKTKGAVIEDSSLDKFGVLAYYLPAIGGAAQTFPTTTGATPDFMYNQLVSRTKNESGGWGDWTYSPVKYWPNNTNDRIKFFAYAPYNANGITLSGNTSTGYPTIEYKASTDITNQPDLMVAQLGPLSKGSAVDFDFKHVLAKVQFSGDGTKEIKSIKIKNIKSKETLKFDGSTKEGYSWTNQGTPSDITSTNDYLFMIPQDASGKKVEVTFEDGSSANLTLPANHTWMAGKAYNYQYQLISEGYNGTIAAFVTKYGSISEAELKAQLGGTCITFTDTDETVWESKKVDLKGILNKLDASSISINMPKFEGSIPLQAFFGCTALTKVSFPMMKGDIGGYSFRNCISLTQVSFPKMAGTIFPYAFYGCKALTKVSFLMMTGGISISAFNGCSALTEASFPMMTGEIGSTAFNGCSALTAVSFPEMTGNIGTNVFYGCTDLTKASFPKMEGNIGSTVFNGCSNLAALTLGPIGNTGTIASDAWDGFNTGSCTLTISSSATPLAPPTAESKEWDGETWKEIKILTTTP